MRVESKLKTKIRTLTNSLKTMIIKSFIQILFQIVVVLAKLTTINHYRRKMTFCRSKPRSQVESTKIKGTYQQPILQENRIDLAHWIDQKKNNLINDK